MMEERGFATVAIGLIRVQMEKVRPPRGLWTPFQLGRPLGEPEDAAFQRRVLLAALGLLERTDGPVILEDFEGDPPGWTDQPGWQGPFATDAPLEPGPAAASGQFAAELSRVRPFWQAAQARFGRTTVGLSAQPPEAWPGFVASALAGTLPVVPPQTTGGWSLRFLGDDIRAMYSEAAQSHGPPPASRQIDAWFWRHTVAGRVLLALRSVAVASEDEAVKVIGTRFIVPAAYVPKT